MRCVLCRISTVRQCRGPERRRRFGPEPCTKTKWATGKSWQDMANEWPGEPVLGAFKGCGKMNSRADGSWIGILLEDAIRAPGLNSFRQCNGRPGPTRPPDKTRLQLERYKTDWKSAL